MSDAGALRIFLTYNRGLIWFAPFDGADQFCLTARALGLGFTSAKQMLERPQVETPSIGIGLFIDEPSLVHNYKIRLRSADRKLVRVPVSGDWIRLMEPIFKAVRDEVARDPNQRFSMDLDSEGRVRKLPADFRTIPPSAH